MTRLTPQIPSRERIERAQTLAGIHAQAKRAEQQADYKAAVGLWEQFLRMEDANAEAWCQLGTAWLNLHQLPNAKACMQQALRVDAVFLPALVGLADCLTLTGEPGKALAKLERARALLKPKEPNRLPFHLARGNALYALGRRKQAEAAYRMVLDEAPTWATAWSTLGNLLTDDGRHLEAREAFRKGWTLSNAPMLGMNYALSCLLLGDWAEGWRVYRERLRDLNHEGFRRFQPVAPWEGQPLDGNLLVYAEQGLGDLVQFARYVPLIRDRVIGEILLEVSAEQVPLMELAAGAWDRIVMRPELGAPRHIEYDAWVGLMDLVPFSGVIEPENAPAPLRFDVLPSVTRTRTRICLHWRGNPTHGNDAQRSIPLKTLAPLVRKHTEYDWIATTPDKVARRELTESGLPITLLSGNLAAAATVWGNCDLVLTVDSGPAHIAASLGVPTWIILAATPDWRWGLQGQSSPWYPSVRLFRQPAPGSWGPVIEGVSAALDQRWSGE